MQSAPLRDPSGRPEAALPRTPARPQRERPTVRQLEYLVALGEALHFRRAAEAASISQPALSAQVQALEDLLGVQLFERTRRKVLLTRAGREAVRRARLVLEQLDGLSDAARSALDALGEFRRHRHAQVLAALDQPGDAPPLEARGEAAHHGFDFGELGHG